MMSSGAPSSKFDAEASELNGRQSGSRRSEDNGARVLRTRLLALALNDLKFSCASINEGLFAPPDNVGNFSCETSSSHAQIGHISSVPGGPENTR